MSAAEQPTADETRLSPDAWLRGMLAARNLGPTSQKLANYLVTNINAVSYAQASEISASAQVSASTTTRLAQQLGFKGWPDLQQALRTRYLAQLSMVDIAEIHGLTDTPFQNALRNDSELLAATMRDVDDVAIARVAAAVQSAKRVHVTAMGSFAAVGQALVHNLQIAGYHVHALLDRDSALSNSVAQMGDGDLLIVCSYWRHYRTIVAAANAAHRQGATVVALTDYLPPQLEGAVDDLIMIPAEGTSFFPSLTVPMAVQQGLVATLAQLDPEATKVRIDAAERLWNELDILIDPRATE
ncbi:MurR/RpiR family transcriptional regulator [Pseudoclavibacter terrae]|uniref:MurR/RpiR family transcriptional regulator n=1 Tax=Pseudoclavibacter terrae TaxID=1530195 RepID=A0A7J5B0P7_9MICO|nr:MurR/RpiR family transcriptional regulator [Pseudoclavibacter terrae]KAB1637491.1 MurR/RpiR family transcriptional regulator [Pseudoclavibacter terrae]